MRCIGINGEMIGVIPLGDAIRKAQEHGLDLVEVSGNADPPVCRIMDLGKFMYDEQRKKKQARKHQHNLAVKEMKFHCNIGDHDYQTKVNHVKGFLADGHKVKVSLMFRGRENAHRELGFDVVNRVMKDCSDVAVVEQSPKLMGRSIIAMIGNKPKP